MSKPQSYALHIALNKVDRNTYGKDGFLSMSETDARALMEISHYEGYEAKMALFGAAATYDRFTQEMGMIAETLPSGGQLFLTFSGHGSEVNSKKGTTYEAKGADEALCFYDGKMVDNVLRELLAKFKPGVRILMVADCCHSGDLLRNGFDGNMFDRVNPAAYSGNRGMGGDRFKSVPSVTKPIEVAADILLLAAAEEDHIAHAGQHLSPFIKRLVSVWNNRQFKGTYKCFLEAMNNGCCENERSVLNLLDCNDDSFLNSRAFSLNSHSK